MLQFGSTTCKIYMYAILEIFIATHVSNFILLQQELHKKLQDLQEKGAIIKAGKIFYVLAHFLLDE